MTLKRRYDDTASREAKRVRLLGLGRFAHCTIRAKSCLVKQLREEGIPKATSCASFFRARREACALMTPYGSIVQPIELPLETGVVTSHVAHPLAMLFHACQQGGAFPEFLRECYDRRPCSESDPWQFILYYDGVGMKVLDTDSRHVEAVYWSVVEFSRPTLNCEAGWFVLGAPRLDEIQKLPGGMSHYAAILLRLLFDRGGEFDARSGVSLPCGENGASLMIFLRMRIVVADEVALKALFHFKGAAGRLPCPLCINATALRGNIPQSPFFGS